MVSGTWPKQRKLIIYLTVLCIVFLPTIVAMEYIFSDLTIRHIAMSALGLALVLTISGLIMTTRTEPKRWRHIYKPMRYDTEAVNQILVQIDREVDKDTWKGYQERTRASLWLREALAEYVELTWAGSPYDFQRMMSTPTESKYLDDKPALKKMIIDMQDLGVYNDKSFLLWPRRKYLKLVDLLFKEVKAP
jgi:hypothetical protein